MENGRSAKHLRIDLVRQGFVAPPNSLGHKAFSIEDDFTKLSKRLRQGDVLNWLSRARDFLRLSHRGKSPFLMNVRAPLQ